MLRIITDSTADLPRELIEKWGLRVAPLTVNFGDEAYLDGIDLTPSEFYEKLAAVTELPTTSQINPFDFEQIFSEELAGGNTVLGIFLASELSGTFQSAVIAKENLGSEQIFLVDSRQATFGLGLLVREAVKMRDQGLEASAISAELNDLAGRVRLLAVVETLKYLQMGGRISKTTAIVGGVLGINPIIALKDGKVDTAGKARGRKAALKHMLSLMEQDPPDSAYSVCFGHTNDEQVMAECLKLFTPHVNTDDALCGIIGSTIGTHAGPGATGIAYIARRA